MRILMITVTFVGMIAYTGNVQQEVTPQTTQQQTTSPNSVPCKSAAQAPAHKQGVIEKKLRELACKKNPDFCSLPNSTDEVLGTTPTAKPCAPTPTPKTQPPPVTPPPAKPVPPKPDAPTDFVCPPKATLIPGQPYCIYSDRKVVDAIPLPAGTLPEPSKPTQPTH